MIARDAVAADQLVYAYPYAVGPAVDVSCGSDEIVVLCPAWAVGGMLGPGRHQYQSPEPGKPLAIYFVLTGPVEVPFDMVTQFAVPGTAQQVIVRASGSVLVRVTDPGMLIAQFVGLPFDRVNDGLMRSVSASVERMLAKVLPRKVAMAGTTAAVCDPNAWPALIAELSGYNPTVGAVHGVQFVQFAEFAIMGDTPFVAEWAEAAGESTTKGPMPQMPVVATASSSSASMVAGEIGGGGSNGANGAMHARSSEESGAVAGEIGGGRHSEPASPAVQEPAAVPLLPNGSRVLVALADGLMHSALIRQTMQGYYELEIEATSDTVWVPVNMVTPQL